VMTPSISSSGTTELGGCPTRLRGFAADSLGFGRNDGLRHG
jgi:hypothetical protein